MKMIFKKNKFDFFELRLAIDLLGIMIAYHAI